MVRLPCLPFKLQILKGVCCLCHIGVGGYCLACGGEQGSFHRTRVQVIGPGRAPYAIVFGCRFVAYTEVNYQVSVFIQTLCARVRKISGALDAVWLWSRCSLRL